MERKVCFISEAGNQGRGRTCVHRLTPHNFQWARACKSEFHRYIGGGSGLHEETTQSASDRWTPCVSESRSVMSNSLRPRGLYSWNSPVQNTGVGSLSLLQAIFPTQGSKSGLPHCRRILYQLSHQGSPSF